MGTNEIAEGKQEFIFSYNPNESAKDIFELKWEKDVSETDKWDYSIAVISGVITATLDIFLNKSFNLEQARDWGEKKTDEFVVFVAKNQGFKGDDKKDAIRFLEKNWANPSDSVTSEFGGARQHHLRDFSHHASIIGLIFSLLTQFTGKSFGTDENGQFKSIELKNTSAIGKDFVAKVYNGVIVWIMHLVSDVAGSSGSFEKGTGVTGPLLSRLKFLSMMPIFKDLSLKLNGDKISLSQLISKMFNGTVYKNKEGKVVPLDLRTEMGITAEKIKSSNWFPIVLNECIIRVFYSLRNFVEEVKLKKSRSISQLKSLNWERIVPRNNRTIKRMLTVSSGVFVTVTTAKSAICATRSGGNWIAYLTDFMININYAGVCNFCFNLFVDRRYIFDDIKRAVQEIKNKYKLIEPKRLVDFEKILLTDNTLRILNSLKLKKILHDIKLTENQEHIEYKLRWLDLWKQNLQSSNQISENYFISDDDLCALLIKEKNLNIESLNLLVLSLLFFVPFYPLKNFEIDKKIRYTAEFEKDILCEQMQLISKNEIETIKKAYKSSVAFLDEKIKKIAFKLTFSLLTGLIFETAIISEVVDHAETIFGGAGFLGFLNSGVAIFTSNGIILNECAKLLTYCEYFLIKNKRYDFIFGISEKLAKEIKNLTSEIDKIRLYKNKNNTTILKQYKRSLNYLKRCARKLESYNKQFFA